jgi:hypothetical protein
MSCAVCVALKLSCPLASPKVLPDSLAVSVCEALSVATTSAPVPCSVSDDVDCPISLASRVDDAIRSCVGTVERLSGPNWALQVLSVVVNEALS